MKVSRQGLIVTIDELNLLIGELQECFDLPDEASDGSRKFQINIINKEECSDTWTIEGHDGFVGKGEK